MWAGLKAKTPKTLNQNYQPKQTHTHTCIHTYTDLILLCSFYSTETGNLRQEKETEKSLTASDLWITHYTSSTSFQRWTKRSEYSRQQQISGTLSGVFAIAEVRGQWSAFRPVWRHNVCLNILSPLLQHIKLLQQNPHLSVWHRDQIIDYQSDSLRESWVTVMEKLHSSIWRATYNDIIKVSS